MTFGQLYKIINEFEYKEEIPKVQIDDLIIKGEKKDGYAWKVSFSNGAYAFGSIRKWFNPETFEENEYSIGITRWDATPIEAITQSKNWKTVQDEHKGKGFASMVFNEILKIAKKFKINIFTIFAPSEDSQKVLLNYTNKKIIIPIENSKAVYGDYYTQFIINWPEADKRIT